MTAEIVSRQVLPHGKFSLPPTILAAGKRACNRFVEFFAANIRNENTRAAYARAVMLSIEEVKTSPAPSVAASHDRRLELIGRRRIVERESGIPLKLVGGNRAGPAVEVRFRSRQS